MADRAPRILLVDDEQPIQTLLSFPLQRDGYEVVQASDGREALARFSEQAFDLVVLDVMLPRMDGLEVCRRLRARSSVPIIMLTAKSEEIDKVLGLELGADDYITKPFSMREFRSRVKAALRRSGMARAGRRRGAADRGARAAHRPGKRTVSLDGETVADDVRGVRDPRRARALAPAGSSRATCCSRACGATPRTAIRARSTSTSATCARRSRRPEGAGVHLHGARRRVPLPRRGGVARCRGPCGRCATALAVIFALIVRARSGRSTCTSRRGWRSS